MKQLGQLIFLSALLALCTVTVYPCSCIERSTREGFRQARAIFIGEVVDINNNALPATVKFKVEKQWKGNRQSEISASWSYEGVFSCGGFLFQPGKRYLVYAYGEQLSVYTSCDRTRLARDAEDDIDRLNSFWFRFFARLFPFG